MQSQHINQTRTAGVSHKTDVTSTKPPAPVSTPMYPSTHLQQTIGNQGVLRLMRSGVLQPKLTVSTPGDLFEEEADRVADQVMRMPDPAVPVVQRSCASCGGGSTSCPACDAEKEGM